MLPRIESYPDLRHAFAWPDLDRYNIGHDVCDRWAQSDPDRIALVLDDEDRAVSFDELRALANRMANLFAECGVCAGDRIGVLLPQRLETAAAHIAALKMGAVSMPLAVLFGADALAHRVSDSGARVVISDAQGAARLDPLRARLPGLQAVISVDGGAGLSLNDALRGQSDTFENVDTHADDPAILIYTSGTTGHPKGALLAHRTLPGHLPGVEMSHDLFPEPGDVIWTPADWAWIGGLLDVLMPALHHGVPVVTKRFSKFTTDAAFDLMRRRGVRNAFLPPTALKMMRADGPAPFAMRSVASGGESLGAGLLEWGRQTFGVTINEFYGQTECNMVVSSAARLGAHRPGVMGWPVPGHDVVVLGADDTPMTGEEGRIAVRSPDPVMFLRYWNNPAATAEKFVGEWLVTGDRGVQDADGALRFVGRDDDVISSGGYRIGPGEIEDTLMRHPAVTMAGVVGKPDPMRGEIVKAYVVLAHGYAASDMLASELASFVRTTLSAHEYPREVAFLDTLPMTTTGKIVRRALRERAGNESA